MKDEKVEDILFFADHISNGDWETYTKFMKYVEDYGFGRICYRIRNLQVINSIKQETRNIKDFENFDAFEKYIVENFVLLDFINTSRTTADQQSRYLKIPDEITAKYLHLHVPKLTGSKRDKIVKLIKQKNWDFFHLCRQLTTWFAHEKLFLFFGYDIEKFKSLDELILHVNLLENYRLSKIFIDKCKTEVRDTVTLGNVKLVHDFVKKHVEELPKESRTNVTFDSLNPIFEQSHHFSNLSEFIYACEKFKYGVSVETLTAKLKNHKIQYLAFPSEVIAEIISYDQISEFGSHSWCLTNTRSHWSSYVSEGRRFFIVWNFNENDKNKIYGIVSSNDGLTIHNCHDYLNNSTTASGRSRDLIRQLISAVSGLKKINEAKPLRFKNLFH